MVYLRTGTVVTLVSWCCVCRQFSARLPAAVANVSLPARQNYEYVTRVNTDGLFTVSW